MNAAYRRIARRLRPRPLHAASAVAAVAATVAAVWTVGAVAARERTAAVEERLQHAVDGVRAAALVRGRAGDVLASTLAASSPVQRAFLSGDVASLRRLRRNRRNVVFILGRRPVAGRFREPSIRSTVEVFGRGRRLGAIVVSTSLDASLLGDTPRGSALGPHDMLLFTRGGRVLAGGTAGATIAAEPGTSMIALAGRRYCAVAAPVVAGGASPSVVALSPAPSNRVGRATGLEAALLGALLVAGVAVLPKRSPAPVPDRRRRIPPKPVTTVRSAIALVGDTLAATHDADALLPVILSAAIEATGASGGEILEDGRAIASEGRIGGAARPFSADLGEPTGKPVRLVVYPPPRGFPPEARDAAGWFSEQAAIALENASLHHLVQRQAVTDELTGLANRRGFMAVLAGEISRADRFATPLAFVLTDIDDFKSVNDRYGHHIGDSVLVNIARVLRSTVREIDVPVRLGGEEFGVLLPDTGIAGGAELAERLRLAVARSAVAGGAGAIRITASFGVAQHVPGAPADELLMRADACLYRAKEEGKDRVVTAAVNEARGATAASPRRRSR